MQNEEFLINVVDVLANLISSAGRLRVQLIWQGEVPVIVRKRGRQSAALESAHELADRWGNVVRLLVRGGDAGNLANAALKLGRADARLSDKMTRVAGGAISASNSRKVPADLKARVKKMKLADGDSVDSALHKIAVVLNVSYYTLRNAYYK